MQENPASVNLHTMKSKIGIKIRKREYFSSQFDLQANHADIANETWARIVSIVAKDADHSLYEDAQLHWISALACSKMRDLCLCSAQIDALAQAHAQTPCQPITGKTILVICAKIIEELDASGNLKKAIEWCVAIFSDLSFL